MSVLDRIAAEANRSMLTIIKEKAEIVCKQEVMYHQHLNSCPQCLSVDWADRYDCEIFQSLDEESIRTGWDLYEAMSKSPIFNEWDLDIRTIRDKANGLLKEIDLLL